MTRNLQAVLSLLILTAAVFWSIYGVHPHVSLSDKVPADQFSVNRAFSHVKAIGSAPHFVGSATHSRVRNYIVSELEKMGLIAHTQQALSVNKRGVVTRPQNILTRIEGSGNGKALLLLSHYDSAVHSSPGAADAASGVATILEGIRAYLYAGVIPKNDIIILFTDAEEIGLNGAEIFIREHPWAKDVGLALNFEARGSGGDSFMLLETNNGNARLIEEFSKAGVPYPVTNSLAYSIYKMLPNDTDLTVFRERGGISGFNFAFIDKHFNYHTAEDTPENLDLNSLAHQGSYLMPLLNHFSAVPLKDFDSSVDQVYVSVPGGGMIVYPFSWILPMWWICLIGFLGIVGFGISSGKLKLRGIFKSLFPLMISLLGSAILGYFLWELSLIIYPQYGEIEQVFTYNGHYYIYAVIFLSLAVCFYTYTGFRTSLSSAESLIPLLFLWILLCGLLSIYLKGAAYFIIPVFFALVQLIILLKRPGKDLLLLTVLSIPSIFLLLDLAMSIPVALGLEVLFLSSVITVLIWYLLWPVFSQYKKLQLLGFLSFLIFMGCFLLAHFSSEYGPERPRPNSLVYLFDKDTNRATWNSYEKEPDSWNRKFLGSGIVWGEDQPTLESKYGSNFKISASAPEIAIPAPFIKVEKQIREQEGSDNYVVKIAPNREIAFIELFTDRTFEFIGFEVNGRQAPNLHPEGELHVFNNRWTDRLLRFYPVNTDTLRLDIQVKQGQHPEIVLYEAAFDLCDHPELEVPPRTDSMIPRPFVLNDAVVWKQTFMLE